MLFELDDILAQVGCPKCGAVINVPYKQMRVQKAAGCGCGALIRLEDDMPIGAVQRLMDELKPISAEIDDERYSAVVTASEHHSGCEDHEDPKSRR